jgi:hypothetical protein
VVPKGRLIYLVFDVRVTLRRKMKVAVQSRICVHKFCAEPFGTNAEVTDSKYYKLLAGGCRVARDSGHGSCAN